MVFAAREAGAALHVAALATAAAACGFEADLIADLPAYGILAQHGIAATRFCGGVVDESDREKVAALCAAFASSHSLADAAALIVGHSAPGEFGLDEAALLASPRELPRFVMQDYWGVVTATMCKTQPHLLVLDRAAAKITRATGYDGAISVIGAPKYDLLDAFDAVTAAAAFRQRIGVPQQQPLIGFYGQNIAALPGYARQLSRIGHCLRQAAPAAALFYRPHPRESGNDQTQAVAALGAAGGDVFLAADGDVFETLSACTVALSCFSSTALDALFIAQRNGGLPRVGFTLLDEDLSRIVHAMLPSGSLLLADGGQAALLAGDEQLEHFVSSAVISARHIPVRPAPESSAARQAIALIQAIFAAEAERA